MGQTINADIRLRRETHDYWDNMNPVLDEGEPVQSTDLGMFKLGDGHTPWRDLAYFTPGPGGGSGPVGSAELMDHINDETPHPVYDEGPSLALIYQNRKV